MGRHEDHYLVWTDPPFEIGKDDIEVPFRVEASSKGDAMDQVEDHILEYFAPPDADEGYYQSMAGLGVEIITRKIRKETKGTEYWGVTKSLCRKGCVRHRQEEEESWSE